MDTESLISDLAFILLLGAFVTILFKWIKQPVVLGYIVAGFLASPHFKYLPSVSTEANIDFWAELGIVVLLFTLGLEFSFKKLVNSGASAVVTALIIVAGMMGVGFAVGSMLHYTAINSLFLGGMLSMSSTTIIIKAFNDLGLRQKKFASMVLAVLIVEDLFAVVMMVLLSSIATSNGVEGMELVYSIAKLLFFLVIWFLVGTYVLPSLLNRWRSFLNSETLLVVSMGLCLGMAVFSVYCGFSLALGAFVMGSILAGTSYAERIETVVTPVKDLFGAVFFISVGMMVQPDIVAEYWPIILLLSCVVVVGMIVFGTLGMLITGQTLQVAIQSGFSLTQIGEFAFIIATLGMSLGVLAPTIYPIVVAVSVLTTFTTPYFIKMALPFYRFVELHLPERLRFLIDRYHADATKEKSHTGQWHATIKRYSYRLVLYGVVLLAISLVAQIYMRPWLDGVVPQWSRLLTLVVTLTVMLPFLTALTQPLARVIFVKRDEGRADDGVNLAMVIMGVLSLIAAIYFVVSVISSCYSLTWGLSVALAVVILALTLLSRSVRTRLGGIEDRFIENLNERELRRSGRNNNLVNDLHLAYVTVGDGSPVAGERLKNSNIRNLYGVNVVSVQRGPVLYTIPGGERRVYPGDVLGVIGTDSQIEQVLPVIERSQPDEGQATRPGDFGMVKLLLTPQSPLVGKTPRTSGVRDRYDALVLAVMRGDAYIDSDPDLVFQAGDLVFFVGSQSVLAPLA